MGEHGPLFYFLDHLHGRGKMELKRHGVQDRSSAIVAVESLIEFRRESSNLRGKTTHDDGDSDEDQDQSPMQDKPAISRDKGKDKKDRTPRKYSCFLCNGPY